MPHSGGDINIGGGYIRVGAGGIRELSTPSAQFCSEPEIALKSILKISGTSLVAQWLRIRLPMQGTRVRSLVRGDPTCCGATKPVHHSY